MENNKGCSSPHDLINCFICYQSVSLIISEEQMNLTLFLEYLNVGDGIVAPFVCKECCEQLKKFVKLFAKSIISEETRLEMDYILGYVKSAILISRNSKTDCGFACFREVVAKKCAEKMQRRQPQIILERLDSKPKERSPTPVSKCSKCSKIFPNKYQLKYHNDAVHLRIRRFKCDKCDKSFTTHQRLRLHKTTPHNPNPVPFQDKKFGCEICEKSFISVESMRNHKRYVHPEKLLSCSICDKKFKRSESLKMHMDAVHENRKFPCQVPGCCKAYSQQQNLANHYRLNHPGFTFPRKRHTDYSNKFTVTNDSEIGESVFECNFCEKEFKTNHGIKQHIRLVHEPKKFECSECGFKASRKCSLDSHVQTHKNKKGDGAGGDEDIRPQSPQSALLADTMTLINRILSEKYVDDN